MLYDNHGRQINYLRLAVTDRCNLRCFYCMPEEGITYVDRDELMTYEEMERLLKVFASLGISKVRITGGEPFLRKDLAGFLRRISQIAGIEKINLTTNGTLFPELVKDYKSLGISSVNLSLDTLNRDQFLKITRRDHLPKVLDFLQKLLAAELPTKINMVVMEEHNTADIIPMLELARQYPVSVRFIEEMPFNGSGDHPAKLVWNYQKILEHIRIHYPDVQKLPDPPFSTSTNYQIPGWKGSFGIIAAYSRTFCGSCNRIRLTPQGMLKTCLYDNGVFNLRDLLRAGASDSQLEETLLQALGNRAKNGWEAENNRRGGTRVQESMATIGG